ncbi:MAG: DNA cytosine methyltransferase [Sphingomicrobium sp.]
MKRTWRRSRTDRRQQSHLRASRFKQLQIAPTFIAADFFCGAGGTTRGLIDAGGHVIAGIDKEQRCERTYVENNTNEHGDHTPPAFLARDIFPKSKDYPEGEQDELAAELRDLLRESRSKYPGVPLLFAICAPCQPFTTVSRYPMSEARLDKRLRDSNLLRAALVFVREHKPDLVLSENVAGISDPRFGGIWEEFRDELEKLGYATGTQTVCASRFGIAQRRKRSILLAVRKDRVASQQLNLTGSLLVPDADPQAPALTVAEVIGHLPPLGVGEAHPTIPNHRTRWLSELNRKRLKAAKPGETNRYMENTEFGDLSLDCHRRVNAKLKTRGFNDVYTRMRPDGPAPTITTRSHSVSNGRFGHYDTAQVRGISLREAAAIQSFRDDYVFHPIDQIEPVSRMIGNAVPPKLASFFADYLVRSLRR